MIAAKLYRYSIDRLNGRFISGLFLSPVETLAVLVRLGTGVVLGVKKLAILA